MKCKCKHASTAMHLATKSPERLFSCVLSNSDWGGGLTIFLVIPDQLLLRPLGRRIREAWSQWQRLWSVTFLLSHYHPRSQAQGKRKWEAVDQIARAIGRFQLVYVIHPYSESDLCCFPLSFSRKQFLFCFLSFSFVSLMFLLLSFYIRVTWVKAMESCAASTSNCSSPKWSFTSKWVTYKNQSPLSLVSHYLCLRLLLAPACLCGWLQRKFQLLH